MLQNYGSATPGIWSNTSRKNIEKNETIQRKATKFITNDYQHDTNYESRL